MTSSCPKLAHAHKLQLQQPVYRTWMLRPDTGLYPRAVNRTLAHVLFTARENGLYTGRGWATSCIQAVHGPVTGRSRSRNGPFSTNGLKRTRGFLAVYRCCNFYNRLPRKERRGHATHYVSYQRPDMLKIESSIRT